MYIHISEKATSFGKRSPPQPLPLYCSVAASVVHIHSFHCKRVHPCTVQWYANLTSKLHTFQICIIKSAATKGLWSNVYSLFYYGLLFIPYFILYTVNCIAFTVLCLYISQRKPTMHVFFRVYFS